MLTTIGHTGDIEDPSIPSSCPQIPEEQHLEDDNTMIIIPWKYELNGHPTQIAMTPYSNSSNNNNNNTHRNDNQTSQHPSTYAHSHHILSHLQHLQIASKIAPFWFLSNYFYNLSLRYTSITSSTVLSSMGSAFTFLFAILTKEESFAWIKAYGVFFGFLGCTITSFGDSTNDSDDQNDNNHDVTMDNYTIDNSRLDKQLWGDIAGLLSAIGYGAYTVLIRKYCPKNENLMSMSLLLGYIGLINALLLSPFAIVTFHSIMTPPSTDVTTTITTTTNQQEYEYSQNNAHDTSTTPTSFTSSFTQEPQSQLTGFILFCLIIKGLFDNVLSDYLWARSVILTSATVATVGLGLTVPLAFLSDLFIMGREDVLSLSGIFGALFVLFGFVLVNMGESESLDHSPSA